MADEITKAEMVRLYEAYLIEEVVNTGTRIYARCIESEDNPKRIVWCSL